MADAFKMQDLMGAKAKHPTADPTTDPISMGIAALDAAAAPANAKTVTKRPVPDCLRSHWRFSVPEQEGTPPGIFLR